MSNIRITYNERLEIEKNIGFGKTYREIGEKIGCHHTTIYQEIRKNGGKENYNPAQADLRNFHSRRASDQQGKIPKLLKDTATQARIHNYLKNFPPDVMVGRARKEGNPLPVSSQTIYRFIYQHRLDWIKYLPYRKRKKYKWKKRVKNDVYAKKTNISMREWEANTREVLGHYEIDTVHLNKGGLLTTIDRKSRYLMVSLLGDLKTSTTTKALCEQIHRLGKVGRVKSITSDNGSEFWGHQEIEKRFGIKYYHCDPYSSWQRGSNENVNRILRRFYPKRTHSSDKINPKDLERKADMINSTPRKILNYSTPYELFYKKFTPILNSC